MGSSPSTTLNTASTITRVEPGWNLSLRMLLSFAVPNICVSPAGLGDDMVAVVVVVLHVEAIVTAVVCGINETYNLICC